MTPSLPLGSILMGLFGGLALFLYGVAVFRGNLRDSRKKTKRGRLFDRKAQVVVFSALGCLVRAAWCVGYETEYMMVSELREEPDALAQVLTELTIV